MTRILGTLTVALLVGAVGPATLRAQQGQQPSQGQRGQQPDTTELVFEREVFTYPRFERRNPFRPLVSAGESGPRFEELTLLGVIHSGDPQASVALLATNVTVNQGQVSVSQQAQTFRVRQGQSLGNVRVLDIQPNQVILEVTEFGITEQRTLELHRPGEGGSS